MTEPVAHDHLRAFVERIERLEEEGRAIGDDKAEVYKEARGVGFDVKVLRKIIGDRRKDQSARMEFEALYDLYAAALDMRRGADIETGTVVATGARTTQESNPAQAGAADAEGVEPPSPQPALSADQLPETVPNGEPAALTAPDPLRSDGPAREDGRVAGSPASNVTQLRPEKRITFNDKPHVDCLDPGQCGGFSNLGLCPRCKAVAGGGAAEIEHHGSVA